MRQFRFPLFLFVLAAAVSTAAATRCPQTLLLSGCDSAVPARLADGTCLQDLLDRCVAVSFDEKDLVACAARSIPGLTDADLIALAACAGGDKGGQEKECTGRAAGLVDKRLRKLSVCAPNELAAKAQAAKDATAADQGEIDAACAALNCAAQDNGCKGEKKCKLKKKQDGPTIGGITCTDTRKPCQDPQTNQPGTIWDCELRESYSFDCKCHCDTK